MFFRCVAHAIFWCFASSAASAEAFRSDPTHITSGSQLESIDDASLGAADDSSYRSITSFSLDLIKTFEGWSKTPYNDSANYCTIGFGHLIARKSCGDVSIEIASFNSPISLSAGTNLLDKDTLYARRSVQNLVREKLTDEQFGALTYFVFNVGVKAFESSTLLANINNGEFDQAVRQFSRWIKAGGRVVDGLIARRACEAALFKGTLAIAPGAKFERGDCDQLGAAPDIESLVDLEVGE